MAISYPLLNGVRYDHSSLDIRINNRAIFGIKSIDYSDNLEPGEVYGTGAQIVGRTRGQYKASGSFELYRAEYDEMVANLRQSFPNIGLYEINFDVVVNYKPEGGIAMITDAIKGCRIKSAAHNSSQGSEALAVKCELHVMYIIKNGVVPITGLKK